MTELNLSLWKVGFDQCGTCYWSLPEFPNGWKPVVSDHSQSMAPAGKVMYVVGVVSKCRIVTGKDLFEDLAVAKNEAIRMALGG